MRHVIRLIPGISSVVMVALLLSSCGGGDRAAGDGRLRVVATTGMIGDAVGTIAGDKVHIQTLMGPGVDPHLYKATKGDLDRINEADLILYNGLYLEAKLADVLERIGRSKPVIAVGESVDKARLLYPDGSGGHPDPHIWFDVALWREAVDAVAEGLIAHDSANAELYRQRLSECRDSLSALHQWVDSSVAGIPESNRVMITAHDAFAYFGRAYSIEVRGLQGISTVAEAGLQDVTSLVDYLVLEEIPAVFVESSVPKNTIEAVVDGCRTRGHDVQIGGELFSDAMGPAGTPEGTYFGMVRHNVTTIVESLRAGEQE